MISLILTSSVLILVIAILRICLRGRISARLQYALWGFVALRLIIPFSLFESPVSVENILPPTPAVIASDTVTPSTTAPDAPTQPTPNVVSSSTFDVSKLAIGVWIGGIALCGLMFVVANLRMVRKLRASRVRVEQIDCKLAVYIVDGLPSPCLYGLWKPSTYLTPASMSDPTRLTHILTHEMTHYRHKDHLWALLRSVCVCVHWYNPLVWVAAVFSRQDSELACDESTIKWLGDENRIAYGKTLIEMMTTPSNRTDLLCCATTMSSGKNEIAERLRRIAKKPRTLAILILVVLLVIGTAVAATFGGAVNSDSDTLDNFTYEEQLWNARSQYVGDAPEMVKLVGLLPVTDGLQYDHIELQTNQQPYGIEIVYTATAGAFARYDSHNGDDGNLFKGNALLMIALVENVDSVQATITYGEQTVSFASDRTWAENLMGSDVRDFAQTPRKLAELVEFISAELTTGTADSLQASSTPTVFGDSTAVSYAVTRFGKGGEVISVASLIDEKLAKEIVMDGLSKSAAWNGVDIKTLEEYYLIRQTFPETGEQHDYYIYKIIDVMYETHDGSIAIQFGESGMYSILTNSLYEQLDDIYANTVERIGA